MKPGQNEIVSIMHGYDGDVPGASLLVVKDGSAVVRQSWGLADVDAGVRATPATNYRLASVTKQFTAAAILVLAQDKKLALSDRASVWLPSLPESTQSITVHQLLTHTSGLIDYEDLMASDMTTQVHDADVLKLTESTDLLYFTPGTGYRYSNTGYALLALVVERASGKSFATFLQERIFVPLQMHGTVAHQDGMDVVPDRAFGYAKKTGTWTRHDQSTTSAVLGDGGIYSSVDDMLEWDAAQYDSRILDEAWLRAAATPHTPTDMPGVSYGFGWRITGETLWHSGETAGFRNVIVRYPSRRVTVVLLTNRDEGDPYKIALAIAKLF